MPFDPMLESTGVEIVNVHTNKKIKISVLDLDYLISALLDQEFNMKMAAVETKNVAEVPYLNKFAEDLKQLREKIIGVAASSLPSVSVADPKCNDDNKK
jgi:hypothetical protein